MSIPPPAPRYWVSPSDAGWTVAHEHQILARYPDRSQATVAAVALARMDRPSELLISDGQGTIVEHRHFEREAPLSRRAEVEPSPVEVEREGFSERSPHQVTLSIKGDLAHEPWLVQLTRIVMDELDEPELYTLIVDMSGVTDFDVACIANWVGLEHYVRDQGRSLRIRNANPVVLDVLEGMKD